MKKAYSALVVAILLGVTGCFDVHVSVSGFSASDRKFVTNITQHADVPLGLKALDVENQLGNLRVTGTNRGSGEWKWKLTIHARDEAQAQEAIAAAKVETTRDGDHLRLFVSLPQNDGKFSFESDLEVVAPDSLVIQARNHFGSSTIFDFTGDVQATGENGSLQISKIGGSVKGKTSFATLKVRDSGPATLENQNGSLEATRIRGALVARTSFDKLTAREVAGPATLHNQNGSVSATEIHGSLDAATSFDDLVARDISGSVKLRNQNGRVEVTRTGDADVKTSFADLKVEAIHGQAKLANQNGRVTAKNVSGDINATSSFDTISISGAGSNFVCHNQNGAIRLEATSSALAHIDAKTSFDTLEVRLPAKLKPAVQAHTTFGEVESDFPVLLKPRGEDPFGDIAPGTLRVTLQNQNGTIRIVGQ